MLREWTIMKNLLRKKKTGINCHDLYCELLQTQPADIQNILTLVNIMVSISPSTAECERQFSAMKLIKSCRRSHMHQDTLEALIEGACRWTTTPGIQGGRGYPPLDGLWTWDTPPSRPQDLVS
ncbi:uncharacterized protein LOC127851047 [Dreissena polymorpha]|uniref:uncharacterized protein LOC127851047 n=1 Tax=Dreissena polymorpha TaxID=45954 RepID=UPI00226479E3|nr:uncharacterized protein LOC127851047 [Dreissena polymorpha]